MKELIVVRGGGDLATGTIYKLRKCGFPVLILETAAPSAIRRNVAFSEAVYQGSAQVEDLKGLLIQRPDQLSQALDQGAVPLLVDPAACAELAGAPKERLDALMQAAPHAEHWTLEWTEK